MGKLYYPFKKMQKGEITLTLLRATRSKKTEVQSCRKFYFFLRRLDDFVRVVFPLRLGAFFVRDFLRAAMQFLLLFYFCQLRFVIIPTFLKKSTPMRALLQIRFALLLPVPRFPLR